MTWHVLTRIVLATICSVALSPVAVVVQAKAPAGAVSSRAIAPVDAQSNDGDPSIGTVEPASAPIGWMASATPRDASVLAATIQQLISASGASAGVSVVELGASEPLTLSVNGPAVFGAASTYKLAALMLEAQNIAAGTTDPNGDVCFQPDDYETGWFEDYGDGVCLSRHELAMRAGRYSDNTAGHMLVRDVGGVDALNAWAASHGAANSAFFVGNTTTSADLAALWVAEAEGQLGGAAAQAWLYPFLTGTRTESGIPAGVPGVTVVHKTGTVDAVDNDAALVTAGPAGAYVLTVMTDGLGGGDGWQLIAGISAAVRQFEAFRTS